MPIAVVQSGAAAHWDSGPDTNFVVTLGSAITPGNLLVFVLGDVHAGTNAPPDWGAMRAGITQHAFIADTSGDQANLYLATMPAGAAESTTFTLTTTRSPATFAFDARFIVIEVSGVDTADPIDVIATQDHGFINPMVFQSVTTTVANTLLMLAVCERNNPGTVAGFTKIGGGFDTKTSVYHAPQAAIGASGTNSTSTFGYGSQIVFALQEAGGGGPVTVTGTASFSVQPELDATGSATEAVATGTADFSSQPQLTATGSATEGVSTGTAAFSAQPQLTATGAEVAPGVVSGTAGFSTQSELDAAGSATEAVTTGTADFSAGSELSAAGSATEAVATGTADFSAASELDAAGSTTEGVATGTADFSTQSELVATGEAETSVVTGTASFSAQSELDATGTATVGVSTGTAGFSLRSQLRVNGPQAPSSETARTPGFIRIGYEEALDAPTRRAIIDVKRLTTANKTAIEALEALGTVAFDATMYGGVTVVDGTVTAYKNYTHGVATVWYQYVRGASDTALASPTSAISFTPPDDFPRTSDIGAIGSGMVFKSNGERIPCTGALVADSYFAVATQDDSYLSFTELVPSGSSYAAVNLTISHPYGVTP